MTANKTFFNASLCMRICIVASISFKNVIILKKKCLLTMTIKDFRKCSLPVYRNIKVNGF